MDYPIRHNKELEAAGIEQGAASIKIELRYGNLQVTHGTGGRILHEVKNVPDGAWDKIWETIRNFKSVNQN